MKKLKNVRVILFLILFSLIINSYNLLAQGNLGNHKEHLEIRLWDLGTTGTLKVEVASVPFEGYTNDDGINRYDDIRYGCLQKRFFYHEPTQTIQSKIHPITYFYQTGSISGRYWFAHTSLLQGEPNTQVINYFFGFSKYKFTLETAYNETYTWYIDYSDSKYGKLYFLQGDNYREKYIIHYNSSNSLGERLELRNHNGTVLIDVITTSNVKKYEIWELITRNKPYYTTEPFEENFNVTCIPFPLSIGIVKDTLREISLFSKATIKTILPYIAEPPIPANINTDPDYYTNYSNNGNRTVTPGVFNTVNVSVGSQFNIESGGELTIDQNKTFSIVNSDILNCKPNSKIILNQNAELSTNWINPGLENYPPEGLPQGTNFYGTIILDNSMIEGQSGSVIDLYELNHNIAPSGGIMIINGDVTIKNTKLNVKKDARLYINDNSSLTLDGYYASLETNQGAKIYLGFP